MTPDDLRLALENFNGEAVATCLATLDDPEARVPDWGDESVAATSSLLSTYRTRARLADERGYPSLGIHETVERLERLPHVRLRLAAVVGGGPNGYPSCVIFLEPDEPVVVAAVAMLRPGPTL